MKSGSDFSGFELYFLKSISYTHYPYVKSVSLIQSNLSAKTCKAISLFPKHFKIDYSIEKAHLSTVFEPLKNCFEPFQFKLNNKREINPKSIIPFNHHLTISLEGALANLIGIIHSTPYSSVPEQKSKVYFLFTQMTYSSFLTHEGTKKKKQLNLNLYKNFKEELDNIKFHHVVIRLLFTQKELIEFMLKNSNLFLLGNEVYNDKIKIEANTSTLNQAIIDKETQEEQKFPIEVVGLLYVLINESVITYFEIIDFITRYGDQMVLFIKKGADWFYAAIIRILKLKLKYQLLKKAELMKLLQNQIECNYPQLQNNKDYPNYLSLDITNFTCFVTLNQNQYANHLMRGSEGVAKQMIYVSFDLFNPPSYYSYYTIGHYHHVLKNGFKIANAPYVLFGYSLLQLKNRTCWFINSQVALPETALIKELSIHHDVQLLLTSLLAPSLCVIHIKDNNIVKKDDVKADNREENASNCSGILSLPLSKQIAKLLPIGHIPSCYIANIQGIQGTWSTYYNNTNRLYYRPSQKTDPIFASDAFEVKHFSYWKQGYLTFELVSLLHQWKYLPIELLEEIVAEYLNHLTSIDTFWRFITVKSVSNMILKLVQRPIDSFIDSMLWTLFRAAVLTHLEEGLRKGKVFFEKSAIVKGIEDEYNVLQGNQVFAIISKANNSEDADNVYLKGDYLVAKYPPSSLEDIKCMHFIQYDIKQLSQHNASYYQRLSKLVNVIVFSRKREESKEWKANWSGYEEYVIFWDERVLKSNPKRVKPLFDNNINAEENSHIEEPSTFLIDNFIRKHFVTSSSHPLIRSIEKTKIKKTPHYLSGKESDNTWVYHSHSILGKYYDIIDERKSRFKELMRSIKLSFSLTSDAFLSLKGPHQSFLTFETEYYLIKVVQSVFIMTKVNSKLQELMQRFNFRSYEEFYVGYLNSGYIIESAFEGTSSKSIESLTQFAIKLLSKDFADSKRSRCRINEYFHKINIITVVLYNVVFNMEEIKLIIDGHREYISDMLLANTETVITSSYDNASRQYECDCLGFDYCTETQREITYSNKEIEVNSHSTISELDNDIVLLMNDSFGINCCFPYLILAKYIIALKQMQHNVIIH